MKNSGGEIVHTQSFVETQFIMRDGVFYIYSVNSTILI